MLFFHFYFIGVIVFIVVIETDHDFRLIAPFINLHTSLQQMK